ncbi:MAG: AMP-binding protein [Gracilimonas sp.]|uniref:AMP-binding protein n=1 Tax=Gracilimonas sp. TaxID=1974203 RepID=UPI0019C3DA87|nr:AMP-binding protein [Gracilimonas sp.]MBD3615436.1 AMP-binding protein [Gracilimonas sp.]
MIGLFQYKNSVKEREKIKSGGLICYGNKHIDTNGLLKKGNAFAHLLNDAGCTENDHFCVVMKKSINFLITLIGINQMGGIVMPVDSDCSKEQMQDILSENSFRWILVDETGLDFIDTCTNPHQELNIGWMGEKENLPSQLRPEFIWDNIEHYSTDSSSPLINPNRFTAMFYLDNENREQNVYLLSNHEVSEFVNSILEAISVDEKSRIAGFFPSQCMPFMIEIGMSALNNAHLQLFNPALIKNQEVFFKVVDEYKATHICCRSEELKYLGNDRIELLRKLPEVKELIIWGPPLPMSKIYLLKELFPNSSIRNFYIITGKGKAKHQKLGVSTFMNLGYTEESLYVFQRSHFCSESDSFDSMPKTQEVHHAYWRKRSNNSDDPNLQIVSNL